MKQFIFISLSSTILLASTVTLEEIIHHAKPSAMIEKRLDQEALALEQENLALTEESPLTVHHALSHNMGQGVSGYEHEIAFSKELVLGEIQALEREQNRLNNEAYLSEERIAIVAVENRLKNLYHQHCLNDAYLDNLQEAYQKFSELYAKKEIAFAQGEIAKTELLQLELERNKLAIELETRQLKEEASRELLLSLTSLSHADRFSCVDVYPIVAEVRMDQEAFSLSQEAYDKRIKSTQAGLKRYAQKIERVELSMGYSKELENDIYTVGVSIPLNFSSKKSEYAKASLLHHSSALALKRTETISQKSYEVRRLYTHLRQSFLTIQAQEQNIEHYQTTLLPLMKKSYNYGESSVIEYLLSQQRLYTLQQELLSQKRDYYQTLFELYTVSEIKEKQ